MAIFARAAVKAFDQGVGTLAAGGHIAQIMVGGGRSVTGLSITTDRAMRYAAFWAAVRILAESMASLPIDVMRLGPAAERTVARDHPVHRLLHYTTNPETTAYRFVETAMTHTVTWGNGYALKIYDGLGALRELRPLATDRMEVRRDPPGFALIYRYTRRDGTTIDLTRDQVFHLAGLGWDGDQGYSVLRMARETIGLGLAAEEHGARFFGSGATSNFVLGTDKTLSKDSIERLAGQIKDEKSGLLHAWEPWVLEEGLKPLTISIPNDDAQWLETRKLQVTDIARRFRIPPHMLADLERATFTNIEHQSLEFVKYTLLPWIVRWEQDIGLQLLGRDWLGLGGEHYVKFNVAALERADLKTRFESYAIGRQWGFVNGDRIADLEDWQRFAGGEDYLVPLNMTTVNPDGSITTTTMTSRNGAKPVGEPV